MSYDIDETFTAIILQESWQCKMKNGIEIKAHLDARASANVKVSTTFGLTILTKLGSPLDLSQSVLYFKNRGEITAVFTLDAKGSVTFDSKDIKLADIPLPGMAFRIPKIVTVGPSFKLYASADAEVSLAGKIESRVKLAEWSIQQTYPQETNDWNPKALSGIKANADKDGLLDPSFDLSIKAEGRITAHLKPAIAFGLEFDPYWKVGSCAAELVVDGYIQVFAELSNNNDCPFKYSVSAGAALVARAKIPKSFKWKPEPYKFPIKDWPITGDSCPSSSRIIAINSSFAEVNQNNHHLVKRAQVYGPIFHIPPLGAPKFCESTPSRCEQLVAAEKGGEHDRVDSLALYTRANQESHSIQSVKAGKVCGSRTAGQNFDNWSRLFSVSVSSSSMLYPCIVQHLN
jgi:chitinase